MRVHSDAVLLNIEPRSLMIEISLKDAKKDIKSSSCNLANHTLRCSVNLLELPAEVGFTNTLIRFHFNSGRTSDSQSNELVLESLVLMFRSMCIFRSLNDVPVHPVYLVIDSGGNNIIMRVNNFRAVIAAWLNVA